MERLISAARKGKKPSGMALLEKSRKVRDQAVELYRAMKALNELEFPYGLKQYGKMALSAASNAMKGAKLLEKKVKKELQSKK